MKLECGRSIAVIILVFQTKDTGSIPVARSLIFETDVSFLPRFPHEFTNERNIEIPIYGISKIWDPRHTIADNSSQSMTGQTEDGGSIPLTRFL